LLARAGLDVGDLVPAVARGDLECPVGAVESLPGGDPVVGTDDLAVVPDGLGVELKRHRELAAVDLLVRGSQVIGVQDRVALAVVVVVRGSDGRLEEGQLLVVTGDRQDVPGRDRVADRTGELTAGQLVAWCLVDVPARRGGGATARGRRAR